MQVIERGGVSTRTLQAPHIGAARSARDMQSACASADYRSFSIM